MKLDKDMVWIGGIGVILYLLATKKSDGSAPGLPETGLPGDDEILRPRPQTSTSAPNGTKRPSTKKPSSSSSPRTSSNGGGSNPVESRARNAAMEKLKEVYQEGGETALTAASQASDVYQEEGGNTGTSSLFWSQLLALSEIDAQFSVDDIKIEELDGYITLFQKNIATLKSQKAQLVEERDKALAIKKQIDDASWFGSAVPAHVIELNQQIQDIDDKIALNSSQMKKDIEHKTHKLAVINVVKNLSKLAAEVNP